MKSFVYANEINSYLDCTYSTETCNDPSSLCCRISSTDNILLITNLSLILLYITTSIIFILFSCFSKESNPHRDIKEEDEEQHSLLNSISNEFNDINNISIKEQGRNNKWFKILSWNISISILCLLVMKAVEYSLIYSKSFYFYSLLNLTEIGVLLLVLMFGIIYTGNLISFYITDIVVIFSLVFIMVMNIAVYDYFNKAHLALSFYSFFCFVIVFIKALYINLIITKDIDATEVNLHREMLNDYVRTLPNDNIELYRETNRVMDMCKLYELITKIRSKRKLIMNIGIIVLFSMLIFFTSAEISIYMKNEKISKVSTLFNLDFKQHNKDIIPSNENRAIFVFIDDNVNISSAIKEKEVIELKVVKRNSIVNYLSEILTGSLPELNGLIGNKLTTKRLRRFDSILNEVKYNNYFEIGREYDAFIKNNFNYYNLSTFRDMNNTKNKDELKYTNYIQNAKNPKISFISFNTEEAPKYINKIKDLSSTIILLPINSNTVYIIDKSMKLNQTENKEYTIADLSSTICIHLGIPIPNQNQGHFISGLFSSVSNDTQKELYYALRNQQRNLYIDIIQSLSRYMITDLSDSIESLEVFTRKNSSLELYINDINEINKIYLNTISHIENVEITTNLIYSMLISLLIIFILSSYIQYFTFANILAIFTLNIYGNYNFISFCSSLVTILLHFFISYYIFSMINNIFLFSLVSTLFAICLIHLFNLAFVFANNSLNKSFLYRNITKGLSNGVIDTNGLAYLYLFRIYNIVVITITSLFQFTKISLTHFSFSNSNIISFLIYSKDNDEDLCFLLLVIILYMISMISYHCIYPSWRRHKVVFDSVFILLDMKNDDNGEENYERQALESNFVKIYTNFDSQSIDFYNLKNKRGKDISFDDENVMIDAMIMNNFLNNKIDLLSLEEGKSSMEILKLDDRIFGKNSNITFDYLRSVFSQKDRY